MVIRNLHPSTPVIEVVLETQDIGYSISNVINIEHKNYSFGYFPTSIHKKVISDNIIFLITSLHHTKVKIKESHKIQKMSRSQNCKSNGHTFTNSIQNVSNLKKRSFRFVMQNVSRSQFKILPLWRGHPVNYKGCTTHEQLT